MSSGTATWGVIALLMAGVVLALGITGLALFIVGLVRKRVGMWVTGLVMGVAVVLLIFVLMGAAFLVARPVAVRTPPPVARTFAVPSTGGGPVPIEANTPGDSNSQPVP